LGSDLSRIANELEKLFIAIGEATLTVTSIMWSNTSVSKTTSPFELQEPDSVGMPEGKRIVNHFEAKEGYPLALTLGSFYFFSKILLIIPRRTVRGSTGAF
jgi:hypothetical protein